MPKRTPASARSAGTRLETDVVRHLAEHVDDRIERRARNGAKDRGDVAGVRLSPSLGGHRVVLEMKDTARISLGTWMSEAETEAVNDDARVAVVVHKRHGVAKPGRQWATMTVDDLIALLTGQRPDLIPVHQPKRKVAP